MNELMKEKNIKLLNVGLAVVLLLSVVYSFVQVFYGMEYPDTFYFISRYTSDGFIDPLYLLSQGIFLLTTKLFGGYLISYKIFIWFIRISKYYYFSNLWLSYSINHLVY